jgi:hypothetical protein
MFVDYLLIPFISLGIDLRRSKSEIKLTLKTFLLYVSYAVAIIITAYVLRYVAARLGVGLNTDPGSEIYTVIATVVALLIPYVKEIIATYVNVRCEIKGKDSK